MPNWKKVIVSGSDASLNSLYVTNAVTASIFSGSFTGSLFGTSSYALDSNLLDGKDSTEFATTGSNIFKGLQTIDGNLFMSGAFRLIYNNDATNNMLFGMFDGGNIYGPYYQIFGNQYPNITQRGSAEFVYDNRNGGESGFNIASFNGVTWTRKFRVDDNGVQITGSLNVSGGITGSLLGTASFAVSASSVTTASFASTSSISLAVTGGFAKSFAIINNNNISATDAGTFPVWRCNVPCTASMVLGYTDAGSSVLVNATKNGSSLLSSDLSISTNTWVSSSTLQNQNFNEGDILAFVLTSFSGTPKEITIQTSFIY